MSYQEQLPTPQKLFYRREQIDESDALAHQALSRILELIREEQDGTSES